VFYTFRRAALPLPEHRIAPVLILPVAQKQTGLLRLFYLFLPWFMFALADCNNFYASCERVFNPKLQGRPVVVLSNNDGCIVARSNEAKQLGIRMGEPAFKIKDLLQQHKVAVFSSNYALYADMSERVMQTLRQLTPFLEVYSIDEAFIDLRRFAPHTLPDFAGRVRQTVGQWTGIPVSVGMAPTKTLAKVANFYAKKSPDGVYLLLCPADIENALQQLPVAEVWGIGRQYEKLLYKNGVETALQLRQLPDGWIQQQLGIVGLRLVHELRGISCLPAQLFTPPKKGICTSRSFGHGVTEPAPLQEAVANFAVRCAEKLRRQQSCANLLTVFIHSNPFKPHLPQYSNSITLQLPAAAQHNADLIQQALWGLQKIYRPGFVYKKAGVYVSGIVPQSGVQGNLFGQKSRERQTQLSKAIDALNQRMGRDTVRYAIQGYERVWKLRQEQLSPRYTTCWNELLTIGGHNP